MKILFTSIGTRGDMEPFLALAEMLKEKGCETVCLFPEQFRSLAEEASHAFESLGPEFMDMLESETGKIALGGSGSTWQKLKAYRKLQIEYADINEKLMRFQYEVIERIKPDRIVHSAKAIYPIIWGINNPGKRVLVSPVPFVLHPVRHYSHIGFNKNFGPFFNFLTFKLGHWGLTHTILKNSKKLSGISGLSKRKIKKALFSGKAIYTISPTLFPQPEEWLPHVRVLGYHERDKTVNWAPSPSLSEFLKRHSKFIFITFGSMSNPDPEGKTHELLKSLTSLNIPALFNTASGGLKEPREYNSKQFHFVDRIPYEWILPKAYAIVHHGGSGTTHMALKYNCPAMIIPHIIDQFYWNKRIAQLGLGPKGPSITRVSENLLIEVLDALWNDAAYKLKAQELSMQMLNEDFRDEILTTLLN